MHTYSRRPDKEPKRPALMKLPVDVTCHRYTNNVMSCHVMSCHVMSCHVMSCHVMSCHVMSCHAMPCHAMPCHAMPCHAMPCHAMPCHVMLCYKLQVARVQHNNIPMQTHMHADTHTHTMFKVLMLNRSICVNVCWSVSIKVTNIYERYS